MRNRSLLVAAAVAVLLGGCAATAPGPERAAVNVPPSWSAADAGPAASLARWWLRFDDPLLADLVGQALMANTRVQGAQAALQQARALRDVAAAGLLPTLDASGTAQRGSSGGQSTGSRFQTGVDASWEPDLFGARQSALDAGSASAEASAASLGDVQVQVAAEVALSYITLRTAQARMAIAADNLALQRETLQITRWREQAGLVGALETEQALAAAEQTAAGLPVLQRNIEQAAHALAALTAVPPRALMSALGPNGTLPAAAPVGALGIPADTLRQRPDVRAAEYQVDVALARLAQADAARLPSVRIGGSLGLSALTIGGLGEGAAVVSAVLASVAMPLFDGGASRAQVRAQQAALLQAHSAYRAAVLLALQEVEDALAAQRSDRARLINLQAAAAAAERAALLARQRYGSGLVDFQTVLDTQRTQLAAQDNVASVVAEIGAGQVRLFKALGGGWRSTSSATP